MLIQENVPLAPYTTLQVGGAARFFVEVTTISEVIEAASFVHGRGIPLFILGGGSNVVVSDAGWPGLVLKIAIRGIDQSNTNIFEVGAGEDWDAFVTHAVQLNCAGIECLSGIPGSVGGTPVQNVGAYGQEVSTTIASVLVLDLKDGQVRELCNEACGFSYRSSIFNTSQKGRFVILRVTFELVSAGEPKLTYADLQRFFAGRPAPSLAETRDAVLQIRAAKGMVISTDDPDSRSAGSFFKNPVLSAEQFARLTIRATERGLQVPAYPALESQHKISAAWLVEHSGFPKGYASGPVGISHKHSLALVNLGGARAQDILDLKHRIQDRVVECWGIRLESEPVFVGF